MRRPRNALPVCSCGSREFEAAYRGRNGIGRSEFRLACRRCHRGLLVDKTTFALFFYLGQRTPSRRFLRLFDLA